MFDRLKQALSLIHAVGKIVADAPNRARAGDADPVAPPASPRGKGKA